MSYKIITIEPFDRQLKRLAKRYVSLKDDLKEFQKVLKENPQQGEPLGKKCFKIRLAISSKNKGKSGGGCVITNVLIDKEKVYLLSIYDKLEQENISDEEIERLLAFIEFLDILASQKILLCSSKSKYKKKIQTPCNNSILSVSKE